MAHFLSYFLLMIIAQFHLSFIKPESIVREPDSSLHFHFLYTHGLVTVTALLRQLTMEWTVALMETTAPALSLNMDNDFQFLFLLTKVTFNSHNLNKMHHSFTHSQFLAVYRACIGLSFLLAHFKYVSVTNASSLYPCRTTYNSEN